MNSNYGDSGDGRIFFLGNDLCAGVFCDPVSGDSESKSTKSTPE